MSLGSTNLACQQRRLFPLYTLSGEKIDYDKRKPPHKKSQYREVLAFL